MSRRAGLLLAGVLALAAPPAHAAEGGGSGLLFWHAVNLLLLLGVLVYFGRAPLRAFLADRRAKIGSGIESASAELAQAERRLAECRARLASLDRELDEIRSAVRTQAENERDRLVAEARVSAERILRDAGAAAEQELRHARESLHAEAAELAVKLAGDLLRGQVTDADRTRLLDEFVASVESTPPRGAARH